MLRASTFGFSLNFFLEGGSVDVNGAGTVLTTEQCLLNEKRNPGRSKQEIEKYLSEYLAAGHVIWLRNGIAGDDTDGHIDNLARFVAPSKVLCAYEFNENDENFQNLRENYEILLNSRDQLGNSFEVIQVPMPPAMHSFVRGAKRRLSASYLNFYIANGVVLVPSFGQPTDGEAAAIIQSAFPERTVVPIDCSDIVYGSGTLHCITQQQPAPRPVAG